MIKNAARLALCFVFAVIPAIVIFTAYNSGGWKALSADSLPQMTHTQKIEEFAIRGIPFGGRLAALGRRIKISGGQHEIFGPEQENSIFISENGLIKNIAPPVTQYVENNVTGVIAFADAMRQHRKPVYIMLIPTSSAVMQQNLPGFARGVMVNQIEFIEDIYNSVSNSALSIDAYSALAARRSQYIYYRTEDNLTSLGGFYVYSAILSRLGIGKASLEDFDIEYANNYFYGTLYGESGYKDVNPDIISLFKYSGPNRKPHEYLVTHRGKVEKVYHTLFPEYAPLFGGELSVFLGGLSAVTDIQCSSQSASSILVFGDKTAVSYLPFLANNCKRVTFVDLSKSRAEVGELNPADYDHIIFAYGAESFMHTGIPAGATAFIEE